MRGGPPLGTASVPGQDGGTLQVGCELAGRNPRLPRDPFSIRALTTNAQAGPSWLAERAAILPVMKIQSEQPHLGLHTHTGDRSTRPVGPDVEIVIPVFQEEATLVANVTRLQTYLVASFPFSFRVTIADNASTDRTWEIAQHLEATIPEVRAVHLVAKGRGRALQQVWSGSDATVVAYMDVDLSTDLAALLPLVAPLISGHSDVAIGSRLSRSSRVTRGTKREVISRCYNFILRTTLSTRFSDAQCGFKAIRADRARELLPFVEDTGWFFDTELLVIAERSGLRIHEVPVDWVDDRDSRVDIVSTAVADLKGIARLGRALATGRLPLASLSSSRAAEAVVNSPPRLVAQLARFAAVGVVSTVAYLLIFLVLRAIIPALPANAFALLVTALANTAANRRMTFGVRGRSHRLRHQAQGLFVFFVGLLTTSLSLVLLGALEPATSRTWEIAVLVSANITATVLRFLLFRAWIFRQPSTPSANPTQLATRTTS